MAIRARFAGVLIAAFTVTSATAQDYPTRPVRVVVGFAARLKP